MIALYLDAVGLFAPGMPDWNTARDVLAGRTGYAWQDTPPAAPPILAPAERRRAIPLARLTLSTAYEALQAAPHKAGAQLACVFASSDGDSQTVIQIMDGLSEAEPEVSPIRFANSVHNATAGYWSIATAMKLGANCISAFDESFAAGLLEAAAQVGDEGVDVLYTASDARFLEPLAELRPIGVDCAVSLLLAHAQSPHSIARLEIELTPHVPATPLPTYLPVSFASCPAARALPLAAAVATASEARLAFDYLGRTLSVKVTPC